ncbi:hypothetical protein NIES2135_54040 [Leptolyngbya boryana NIES-2135]|uniref:Lipoprotein n=1 Tax=Leptolyngbya boryana NIES-2135 TaxID=1973484 RepID=A0A1Z4JP41_LEPBY|nr:hypothetical protein NIES2135_54040 [Leptolyngbya boryana NIES-2135]
MSIFAPKPAFLIAGILLLSACEKNEFTVPVPVGGGGSGYSDAPSRSAPIAPPAFNISEDPGNIPGQREVHYAATEQGCQDMARRFKNEGRQLRLRKTERVGGPLSWKCVFEGSDATDNYYGDDRYGRDN